LQDVEHTHAGFKMCFKNLFESLSYFFQQSDDRCVIQFHPDRRLIYGFADNSLYQTGFINNNPSCITPMRVKIYFWRKNGWGSFKLVPQETGDRLAGRSLF